MEGLGSRLGRASSRYGPATTVFNGPVRKWKKKWVHVSSSQSSSSSSSSSTVSYHHNSHSQSNGQNNNNNNNNNGSRLLLCRWTPLSSTSTTENGGGQVDEPPKRRFRYTPIAVLEEKKKAGAKKVEEEAKASEKNQFTAWSTSKSDEMNIERVLKIETQDSNTSHLDLGLCLKGHDDHDSGHNKEGQSKGASSGGYWTMIDTQHPL